MTILLRGNFGLLARNLAEGKWSQLFPLGKWHGPNFEKLGGSLDLTPSMMGEMVANWRASGSPALPVYFHHPPKDRSKVPAEKMKEVFRAAGWIEDIRQTERGLEAAIKWSTEGQDAVGSDAYRFISPEWQPRDLDRSTGALRGWTLTGAALTDDPFFHTMPAVAAAALPAAPKGSTMTEEQLKLRASLGLAATATDAEVLTAQTKQAAELATLRASVEKPTLTKEDIAAAVAVHVEPLKASLESEKAARAKLEAESLGLKVDALIASAKAGDGKTGRALVDEKVRPVLLKLIAAEKTTDEGIASAKGYLDGIPLTAGLQLQTTGTPGTAAPLTAASANAKIASRADELRKAGDPTPTISAMREMPTETLIAENRRPTPSN